MRSRRAVLFAAAVVALSVAITACSNSDGGREPPAGGNLFPNPSFEEGRDPWYSLKPPDFELAQDVAHSGQASALLRMSDSVEQAGAKIYYLVQEVAPQEFPEVISGYYRVDGWVKGTAKQYLQFVVIAFGPDNLTDAPNVQIRYLLAGIDAPPFPISNAKFVFLSRDEPVTGEWVHFQRNLREDFKQSWGAVPKGFDKLRILFEVRFDDKVAGQGAPRADVHYDDLYMGPAGSE